MDYCDGGDICKYIQRQRHHRVAIPESTVLHWFTQVALALKYMHHQRSLHRDIKPQNIFFVKREQLAVVKLADFGTSKMLSGTDSMAQTMTGTPYYLSPEICKKQSYTCPSDMWALGCVLFELCALQVPFEASSLEQLLRQIVTAPIPLLPSSYSHEVCELVVKLLQRDPKRRLTASDVLQRDRMQKEIKVLLGAELDRRGASGSDRTAKLPVPWLELVQVLSSRQSSREPSARASSSRAPSPELSKSAMQACDASPAKSKRPKFAMRVESLTQIATTY